MKVWWASAIRFSGYPTCRLLRKGISARAFTRRIRQADSTNQYAKFALHLVGYGGYEPCSH
jgi:hypothetical protein